MSSPYDAATANMLKCWGGQYGVTVINNTATHTPPAGKQWGKIVAKGVTVLSALSGNWSTNPINLADGEAIYGRFTSLQLSSGIVYAHIIEPGGAP